MTTEAGHHCGLINNVCIGTNLQYNNDEQCMKAFNNFPISGVNATTPGMNDQGCRQYHAQAAKVVGLTHCQHGGPSGGGVCGYANSSRTSWQILSGITECKTLAQFTNQQAAISAAFASWAQADLNAVVPAGNAGAFTVNPTGNSDTCRLYHMTVATVDQTHCSHGSLLGGGACGDLIANVCLLIATACPTAYATAAECASNTTGIGSLVFAAVPRIGDPNVLTPTTDTLACRVYQAASALAVKKMGGAVTSNCGAVRHDKFFGACVGSIAPAGSGAEMVVPAFAAAFLLFAL